MKLSLRDHWFSILLILVVCTRVPFLFTGYGADPDAWRVGFTALTLWEQGTYIVSRFPGYPLHEFLSAPFVGIGGPVLSNLATLAATLILLTLWKQFAETHGRNPKLLVTALAFAPQFWENSAVTMDYHWSLLVLLASYGASLNGKPVIAGICLGLAAGFRPTNVVAVVPVAILLATQPKPLRAVAFCFVSCGVTTLAAFLPVFVTYGVGHWIDITLAQSHGFRYALSERAQLFLYRSLYSVGPLAAATAFWLMIRHRKDMATLLRARDNVVISSASGLVAFLLLFFWFPIEREYLLPAFIFLFLIIDRCATPREFLAFTVCVVSFAFVNPDVVRHTGVRGTPGFNVHGGSIIDEWVRRDDAVERRKILANFRPAGKGIIMTAGGQIMWFENENMAADSATFLVSSTDPTAHFIHNPDFHIVDAMKRDEVELARSMGYAVYCFAPAREYLEAILGYSMEDAGVTTIP